MASAPFITFAILALLTPTFAKEIIVGDAEGWRPNFDYQEWAKGKEFAVGDNLVFNYTAGSHNVFKVNATGFQQCIVPPPNEALGTGHDVITLSSPGNKWYICGVDKHCADGKQKLAITVLSSAPAPTPPSSAAAGLTASTCYAWMAAVFGILLRTMV